MRALDLFCVDLFCGCGGSGLALRQAGFQVLGIDRDRDAVAVYRQAVGDAIIADVRDLDPRAFGPTDLIWASPPCPPWSEARRAQRRLSGFDHPDGILLLEPVRWAREIRPRWLIVENVDGIPDEAIAMVVQEQGFPDDHPLHTLVQERPAVAWRLLGNAVPVPLARAVVRAVMEAE